MPDFAGKFWVHWTARLIVAAWSVAVFVLVARRPSEREPLAVRWIWTLAWSFLVVHTLCAYHFAHHWSHAAASEHTIRQTKAVTGVDFRYGLFVNYAWLAWWTFDVAAWWLPALAPWRKGRSYQLALHGTFSFLILNATVVFGPAYWKAVGLVFAVALAGCLWRARRPVVATK